MSGVSTYGIPRRRRPLTFADTLDVGRVGGFLADFEQMSVETGMTSLDRGAALDESLAGTPTLGDRMRALTNTGRSNDVAAQIERQRRDPDLTVEDANTIISERGLSGHLKVPEGGISQNSLDMLMRWKDEELLRKQRRAAAPDDWEQVGLGVIAGISASVLDPTSVIAAAIPFAGPARLTQAATRAGRVARGALAGSVAGAAESAVLEPFIYSSLKLQQADYDLTDSMMNIMFGAGFGGILGGAGGAFRRAGIGEAEAAAQYQAPPEVQRAGFAQAVSAVEEGRPVRTAEVVALAAENDPRTARAVQEAMNPATSVLDSIRPRSEYLDQLEKAWRDINDLMERRREFVQTYQDDPDRRLARIVDEFFDELPEDTQRVLFGRVAADFETGERHRIGVDDPYLTQHTGKMNVHGTHIWDLREEIESLSVEWANSKVEAETLAQEVVRLKKMAGRDERIGPPKSESLANFVADNGGLSLDDPRIADVRSESLRRPGLFRREGGKSLDEMREAAAEAGYFGAGRDPGDVTLNEFIDAMGDEARGTRRFIPEREAEFQADADAYQKMSEALGREGLGWNDDPNDIARALLDADARHQEQMASAAETARTADDVPEWESAEAQNWSTAADQAPDAMNDSSFTSVIDEQLAQAQATWRAMVESGRIGELEDNAITREIDELAAEASKRKAGYAQAANCMVGSGGI